MQLYCLLNVTSGLDVVFPGLSVGCVAASVWAFLSSLPSLRSQSSVWIWLKHDGTEVLGWMLDLGGDVAGGLAWMEASGPLIRDWVDAFNQWLEEIHRVAVRALQTLGQ